MENHIKDFLKLNNISESSLSHDKKIKELSKRLPIWLNEIDDEHRIIFLTLLKYFQYFDRERVYNEFLRLYTDYKKRVPQFHSTIYAPVTPKKPVYNGVDEFLHIFREVCSEDVVSVRIASQLNEYLNTFRIEVISNIVLIDDIIGTGSTFKDFIIPIFKKHSKKLKNKNIFILCLVAHPKGLKKIKALEKQFGIKITCLASYRLEKAFGQGGIFKDEKNRINAKRIVRNYEEKIAARDDDIMGFQESEGLVSFFYNTPNNTLSTFWEQQAQINWYPIFPRVVRGTELPLIKSSFSLNDIRKRAEQKSKAAIYIYNKIKSEIKEMGKKTMSKKRKPHLNMQRIVTLIYLNETKTNYIYKDLKDLTALNFKDIDLIIQELKLRKYINYSQKRGYYISLKGERFLKKYGLFEFTMNDFLKMKDGAKVLNNPDFSKIYIPRDFD